MIPVDPGLWRDRIILDEFIAIVHSIEWDVSLLNLYGGEFTFSTQLLTLNYLLNCPTDAAPQFTTIIL